MHNQHSYQNGRDVRAAMRVCTPITIRYGETDMMGVVYHANYLKFMERARSDMLRRIGFGQNDQRGREDGVLFVVASLNIAYHRAAVLDDDLEVITSIEKLGRASLIFEQRIVRGDEPIATGKVCVGVIGARSFVPTPLPDDLYETIKAFMAEEA